MTCFAQIRSSRYTGFYTVACSRTRSLEQVESMRNWVRLTCAGRQDVDKNVLCQYSVPDFMAKNRKDMVVVLPSNFHSVSQMVASVVVRPECAENQCEVAVYKPLARCDLEYRLAYVSQHYEMLGTSDAFEFFHGPGESCKCHVPETALPPILRCPQSARMNSFISMLMALRSDAHCSQCNAPSNYPEIMTYLMTNIESLTDVKNKIANKCTGHTEYLKNALMLTDHLNSKTTALDYEIKRCEQFMDDLVANLQNKNSCYAFRSGQKEYFIKMADEKFALEFFMNEIIKSQERIIRSLSNKYQEIEVMLKIRHLFMPI
ncbi:uncharacterized protein LOC126845791 [Adelges cooleyi]|uniref:uncharacterized protein LOC126845791 n=1 Tax=Adelges cooleyi TaxID=133065 RepID=UPI00217F9268|nr:uncharacterized protein LOC126845791 [Adelges cooleyi]